MKNIFLRVPKPDGKSWAYVEVDLNRLNRGMYTELYQKNPSAGQGFSYSRVANTAACIDTPFDTYQIEIILKELLGDCTQVLNEFGQVGKTINEQQVQPLSELATVFKAIAQYQPETAQEALQQILYSILGGSSSAAEKFKNTDSTASGMIMAYDRVNAVIEHGDQIAISLYRRWADTATTLQLVQYELEAIQTKISGIRDQTIIKKVVWEDCIGLANPIIGGARQFLMGDNSAANELYNFVGSPDGYDFQAIQDKTFEIAELVSQTHQCEKEAKAAWQEAVVWLRQEVDNLKTGLHKHLQLLQENSKRLESFISLFGTKGILEDPSLELAQPYEIAGGKFITQVEYEQALTILRNEAWRPRQCKDRFDFLLVQLMDNFGSEPELPADLTQALKDTERGLDLAIEILTEMTGKNTSSSTISITLTSPIVHELQVTCEAINKRRLEQLYELLICMGFVVTCKPHPRSFSTVSSMLKILQRLGKLSAEESKLYSPHLHQYMLDASRTTNNPQISVTDLWRNSKTDWVFREKYLPGGPGRANVDAFKLSLKTETKALELMNRLDLPFEKILKAYQDKKSEEILIYQPKKPS